MAITKTQICNLSLSDLGAKKLTDFDTDTSVEGVRCRLHYDFMRRALLRSHYWPFACHRKALTPDTNSPDFEFDNQFVLPDDFLFLRSLFDDRDLANRQTVYSYAIEGKLLLSNEAEANIRYTRNITDPNLFDPLFIQVFAKQLSIKLVMPLSQDVKLKESLKDDLARLMPKVRALDRQEQKLLGRSQRGTWVDARAANSSRIDSRLGS